jgi:hypothetical protein
MSRKARHALWGEFLASDPGRTWLSLDLAAGISLQEGNNSEKNSEIFGFAAEIAEICPRSTNLILGTGDNSEITVNSRL